MYHTTQAMMTPARAAKDERCQWCRGVARNSGKRCRIFSGFQGAGTQSSGRLPRCMRHTEGCHSATHTSALWQLYGHACARVDSHPLPSARHRRWIAPRGKRHGVCCASSAAKLACSPMPSLHCRPPCGDEGVSGSGRIAPVRCTPVRGGATIYTVRTAAGIATFSQPVIAHVPHWQGFTVRIYVFVLFLGKSAPRRPADDCTTLSECEPTDSDGAC